MSSSGDKRKALSPFSYEEVRKWQKNDPSSWTAPTEKLSFPLPFAVPRDNEQRPGTDQSATVSGYISAHSANAPATSSTGPSGNAPGVSGVSGNGHNRALSYDCAPASGSSSSRADYGGFVQPPSQPAPTLYELRPTSYVCDNSSFVRPSSHPSAISSQPASTPWPNSSVASYGGDSSTVSSTGHPSFFSSQPAPPTATEIQPYSDGWDPRASTIEPRENYFSVSSDDDYDRRWNRLTTTTTSSSFGGAGAHATSALGGSAGRRDRSRENDNDRRLGQRTTSPSSSSVLALDPPSSCSSSSKTEGKPPSHWRGTRSTVWTRLIKSVIDVETDALTPRQLKAHQNPEIMMEIVECWFANLKGNSEHVRTLKEHLLLLYDDVCAKCFHLHPKTANCFCPCWLKIFVLLTNDVDEVYGMFPGGNSTTTTTTAREAEDDCVVVLEVRTETATAGRRSTSRERTPTEELSDDDLHTDCVEVDASSVEPVSLGIGTGRDTSIRYSVDNNAGPDLGALGPVLGAGGPDLCAVNPADDVPPPTVNSTCPDPSFIVLVEVDPTLDPVAILDHRECHCCLEDGCRAVVEGLRCRYDQRLCLVCFHRHSLLDPCACDCKQKAWRESMPGFDFEAMLAWDCSKRRDSPPVPSYRPPTHLPPPFVSSILRNPGANVALFAEKAFCRVCLLSTHAMDECVNGYICLQCFHEHDPTVACPLLAGKSKCDCLRLCLAAVFGTRLDAVEAGKIETWRREDDSLLDLMANRRSRFREKVLMSLSEGDRARSKNAETGKKEESPAADDDHAEEEATEDVNKEMTTTTSEIYDEVNHVIPKFVIFLIQKMNPSDSILRLLHQYFPLAKHQCPKLVNVCVMCLEHNHSTKDCKDGFVCLNCFHTHPMGEKCRCFCYLATLEKTKGAIFAKTNRPHWMRPMSHTMALLRDVDMMRIRILKEEGFGDIEKETTPVPTSEPAAVTPLTVPAAATTPTTTTPTTTTPTTSMMAVITPVGQTTNARLGDDEFCFVFEFPNANAEDRLANFYAAQETLASDVMRVTAKSADTVAGLKLSFLNLLGQYSTETKFVGDLILKVKNPGTSSTPCMPLINGRLIGSFNFAEPEVYLNVEFRDDVGRIQRDFRTVTLRHPVPPFLAPFLDDRRARLLTVLGDDICLVCLAGRHAIDDCREIFFCLGCFHHHKIHFPCNCKCLKHYLANIKDKSAFDLKEIEIWNYERIVTIYSPSGGYNQFGRSSMGFSGGAKGGMGLKGCVLMVSNLEETRVTPDILFTLFGVYGDVLRVKILFAKKDKALIQMTKPWMAQITRRYLDKVPLFGKLMNVSPSEKEHVQRPKDDWLEVAELTKDYSGSPLHRFKNRNSLSNIFEPSSTLHITNITEGATEEEIQAPFREHGKVVLFKFFQYYRTMAYITMSSLEEAIHALIYVHNRELRGRHLRVSFSKPP